MAKAQFHLTPKGPERCRVDSSNPRSTGCKYGATGHFPDAPTALGNYAKLNRVDPQELAALVKDGAQPRDAIDLIRQGYGSGHVEALRRAEEPQRSYEDALAEHMDSRHQALIELREKITPELQISIKGTSQEPEISVAAMDPSRLQRFAYVVRENPQGGVMVLEDSKIKLGTSLEELQRTITKSPELKSSFEAMLRTSRTMLREEENGSVIED